MYEQEGGGGGFVSTGGRSTLLVLKLNSTKERTQFLARNQHFVL